MPSLFFLLLRPINLPKEPPMEDQPTRLSEHLLVWVHDLLTRIGLDPSRDAWLDRLLIFLAILIIGIVLHLFCRHAVIPIIAYTARHSKMQWDSILLRRRFFHSSLDLLAPMVSLILLPLVITPELEQVDILLTKSLAIYLTILAKNILVSLAGGAFDYYHLKNGKRTISPYKTALDMLVIFIKTLMVLCILGILLNLTLSGVITILSAFAALLVLVFKDTLLGFIAGMVLLHNKMIKPGDWIIVTTPSASGQIEEINIMSIRIRAHDNTFYFIPTYNLVTRTFQNYAGMKESGIRRVDRILLLDLESIRTLEREEVASLCNLSELTEPLNPENRQIFMQSATADAPTAETNLSLFRRWLYLYLGGLPNVSKEPYLMIRLLEISGKGYPLELMFFLKTTVWKEFETQQAAIAEQILFLLPVFGLRPFQLTGIAEAEAQP